MRDTSLIMIGLCCLISCVGCKAPKVGPATVVYLVRHAEKGKKPKQNPSLQPIGHKRALALRRFFHSVPLHAVFATEYVRTQQTVAPTANAKRLPVKVKKAHGLKALVAQIKRQYRGKSVLVSGHSNTIPKLVKLLGLPFEPAIAYKTGYDSVFVVVLRPPLDPTYLRFHVGPLPPNK